jgi:hypothetical protein
VRVTRDGFALAVISMVIVGCLILAFFVVALLNKRDDVLVGRYPLDLREEPRASQTVNIRESTRPLNNNERTRREADGPTVRRSQDRLPEGLLAF